MPRAMGGDLAGVEGGGGVQGVRGAMDDQRLECGCYPQHACARCGYCGPRHEREVNVDRTGQWLCRWCYFKALDAAF